MKNNLKTAVIGIGNMGKNHARVLSEISNLVGVADLSSELGIPLAEKFNTKFYSDYTEMLDLEKPDAVSIAVPTHLHKTISITCIKKGIPVLIEKPIADSLEAAKKILNEAKKRNAVVMIGHIERYNPALKKLKQLIDNKKLGEITNLLGIRVGISPPKTENSDVVLDLAIHDVDIFNYLLDEYPSKKRIIRQKIFNNNIADSASVLLEYKRTTGLIQTNWITPIKARKLYVTGTNGFAELDYIRQKLVLYDKVLGKKGPDGFFRGIFPLEPPKKAVFISKKEPLKEELISFLKKVRKNEMIESQYAVEALKVVL